MIFIKLRYCYVIEKNPSNNSPSYEQPGFSTKPITYPSHSTHNENWNAQGQHGHNQQGISGVTVNHQGSATTNQGYGQQGSVNSQGHGHQGHYGGSVSQQGGSSISQGHQSTGQSNTQGYGHHQGHFDGSSTNQQGYNNQGNAGSLNQHGYNHQSNYGTSSSSQWQEGTDQSYYDSQYQGSSQIPQGSWTNPASQHHDHHGHYSGSGNSNFGQQVPQYGQNGQQQPHGQYQTTAYPYKLDVRGSYPDPNPQQPSKTLNAYNYIKICREI